MSYLGCYEHSESNTCSLAYPTFVIDATISQEITFTAHTPIRPALPLSFDDSTAQIPITTQKIPHHFQHSPSSTVQISSTIKTKPIKYIPSRATDGSIGYDLRSVVNTTINPHSRKTIGLGFNISIPE